MGLLFVSTDVSARAEQAPQLPQTSADQSNVVSASTASVCVQPGPFETERQKLLSKIQAAKDAGIGIQSYIKAFQDIDGMVGKGESSDIIRKRLDSLTSALNEQLAIAAPKIRKSTIANSEVGIVGLKFVIASGKLPEIATTFPDAPAYNAGLSAHDVITQVDGISTNGLGKEDLYQMLVGKPGTKVSITIQRGNATFVKTLTRMNSKQFSKAHPAIWNLYLTE